MSINDLSGIALILRYGAPFDREEPHIKRFLAAFDRAQARQHEYRETQPPDKKNRSLRFVIVEETQR